jgi:DHA2 family multidrug resistance protein-like MFS transporter
MTHEETKMQSQAPYPRRWKALVVLALSLLVVTVDNTILNVGLPTIRRDLGASASQLQWVVDSYLLVFAVLLLLAGSLSDRFGRRRALFAGLTVFGTGSLLAALSGSSTELIASRALMGVGAAAIMPTTLSIITDIFPSDERAKAISIWAAVSGMGVAIGPISGGFLLEHFSWNSIFLVNLPIVAGCLIAGRVLIPESRDPGARRLDFAGAALSIAGLTAVVWGLIQASDRGWTDGLVLVAFAAGFAVLAGFVAWERRVEHPMLDVGVFRNLRFTAASVSIMFVFFALMGVIFFLTTYLQSVMGYTALQAGVRMLPVAVGMVLTSRVVVALTQRLGTKIVVALGLGTFGGALLLLAGAGVDTGYARVGIALYLMGTGMALAMTPATDSVMGSLPKEKAGIGSAMNDVVREVGATLGVAVLGSVLSSSFASGMDGETNQLPGTAAAAATDSLGGAHDVAAHLGGSVGAQLVDASNLAFVNAMSTTATIAACVAFGGALIAAAFLPSRAGGESRVGAGEIPDPAPA